MMDIARRRLANQGFFSEIFHAADQVVVWLGAIQAQDYAGGKWSIGLRLPGSSDTSVEEAIAKQRIVRTWAMRGTLHFVAAEDVHWLLALLGPRIISRNGRRYRQLELDEATLAQSAEILARALENGRQMDRQDLSDLLQRAGISTAGQRLFYMLQHAALSGLIGQGTAPKNKPLFAQLPPPADPLRLMDREEALRELASRYFTSRGPATLEDFTWWSGLLSGDAKTGLDAAKTTLIQEKIGQKTYWFTEEVSTNTESIPGIILLPGFDEYLVSYRDRSAVIADDFIELWSKSKAMFSPSIVLRGQVIGLWKRAAKKHHIEITTNLFTRLTAEEEKLLHTGCESVRTISCQKSNLTKAISKPE